MTPQYLKGLEELESMRTKAAAFAQRNDPLTDAERAEQKALPDMLKAKTDELAEIKALADALEDSRGRAPAGSITSLPVADDKTKSLGRFDESDLQHYLRIKEIGDRFQGIGQSGWETVAKRSNGKMISLDADGWNIPEKQWKAICEPSYKAAFDEYIRSGAESHHPMSAAGKKTLIEGIDADGGYLVPPEYVVELISRLPYPTSILEKIRTMPCSRDKVIFPRNQYDSDTNDIYTSPVRMVFGSDQGSSPELDPTFGAVEIPINTAQFPIEVNRNLLEDSAIPVGPIIMELASEAYRLGLDNYVVAGNGVNQPRGLLSGAGTAGLNFPTQLIGNPTTPDGLSDLVLTLPPQYRTSFESTAAVVNATSGFATYAKLKDNSGQYIFGLTRDQGPGGMIDLRIARLMGHDVIFSAFMPNVGAGATPILFGDLKQAYILCHRVGLSVFPYGDQDKSMLLANKVGYLFRCRAGGQVVQSRACHVGLQS